MRTSRSLIFSIVFLLFTTLSAAWPWPRWLPELDSLVARQDNNAPEASATASPTKGSSKTSEENSSITPSPTKSTGNKDSSSTDESNTTKETGSKTSGEKSGSRTTSKVRTTSYDNSNPAGGVVLATPAVTDGAQYYKIGDFVTFAWNYTNLLASPTAINVVASCAANNQVYPIISNQTVTNATQKIVWDTNKYQQSAQASPLLTEKYTLIIYDAQSSISAQAQPGYLAVYNQYQFGMYVPQEYTPLNEWQCATCSGALGEIERRALGMVIGMSVLTVLSFTWFVGGTGVIW